MTILHVQFPNWPGWNMPECTLTSLDNLHNRNILAKDITVSVDPSSSTDYCCDSPVFRAFVVEPIKSKKLTVALKFAMRDDLIADLVEEADAYTGALKPVQGSAVPRCYGLYVGEGDEGQTIACLVLEYWGECLRQRFSKLSINTRMQILNRVGEIHKHGLSLGDFAERNILEKNGDIRIIDFDMTTPHKCKCKMNFRPGDKVPDEKEFGCEQLWEICRYDLKIWAN